MNYLSFSLNFQTLAGRPYHVGYTNLTGEAIFIFFLSISVETTLFVFLISHLAGINCIDFTVIIRQNNRKNRHVK